jgi:predicted lipase
MLIRLRYMSVGLMHDGFWHAYNAISDALARKLQGIAPPFELYITGHSLGAALAVMHAFDVATSKTICWPVGHCWRSCCC